MNSSRLFDKWRKKEKMERRKREKGEREKRGRERLKKEEEEGEEGKEETGNKERGRKREGKRVREGEWEGERRRRKSVHFSPDVIFSYGES
jgi:hypothetical protein